METKEISKGLKKTNVKNITLNQMNIINAIKAGLQTSAEIAESLSMDEHIVKSILGTLIKNGFVEKSENEDNTIFVIVPATSGKKIQLVGDLNFPVASFVDASGQRWVTRDTWHKIDTDIDIVNDIEWLDSKSTQNQKLKEVMKEAGKKERSTKKSTSAKGLKSDPPASEEQRKLISKNTIDFRNVNEKFKLRVLEISATQAIVVFSPRVYLNPNADISGTPVENSIEFTHGLLTVPTIISIEELTEYLNGTKVPAFNKEIVENATDTCFITGCSDTTLQLVVIRSTRKGLEYTEWEWVASTNTYNNKSTQITEKSPAEIFALHGNFTAAFFA